MYAPDRNRGHKIRETEKIIFGASAGFGHLVCGQTAEPFTDMLQNRLPVAEFSITFGPPAFIGNIFALTARGKFVFHIEGGISMPGQILPGQSIVAHEMVFSPGEKKGIGAGRNTDMQIGQCSSAALHRIKHNQPGTARPGLQYMPHQHSARTAWICADNQHNPGVRNIMLRIGHGIGAKHGSQHTAGRIVLQSRFRGHSLHSRQTAHLAEIIRFFAADVAAGNGQHTRKVQYVHRIHKYRRLTLPE
jgi:hypothetical protein